MLHKYGKRESYDLAIAEISKGHWRVDPDRGHILGHTQIGGWHPIGSLRGGYLRVRLSDKSHVSAHRVIWEFVYGPSDLDLTINHINGDHADNRISNLELTTNKENIIHGHSVLQRGNGSRNRGSSNPQAKLTEQTASLIKFRLQNGSRGSDLAREFGVSPMTISDIKHGKLWKDVA